jgi:hypothetical protein
MTGGPVDGILLDAYVSTALWNEPIAVDNRASIPLFRRVHSASASVAHTEVDDGSGDLESALQSIPIDQRGALLLTLLENLSPFEASQVLAVTEASVLDHASAASSLIRQRVPSLSTADTFEISRALGDLPVSQASPRFWARVEADLSTQATTSSPVLDPTIAEPVLTVTPPPPARESLWPAIWAGVGAVAVITLIIVFLVSRSPDDEIAAQAVGSASTDTLEPTDDQTTTASSATTPPPTTAPPTSSSTTVAPTAPPPTPAPSTAPPPTSPPPTTAAPTTTAPVDPGVTDRGPVPFQGNLAIIEGSVAPGGTEIWQVTIQNSQFLSIAATGMNGVAFSMHRADGSTVVADFADSGLQVFTEPGSHVLRFSDGGGAGVGYAVGIGLTGPRSGFLTNLDEQGVAFSTLEMTSCARTEDQFDASLVTGGGAVVVVAFRQGTEPDTVTWLGVDEGLGEITSTSSVPGGLVFTGSITVGRETLLGLPFWIGVYGCEQTS